MLVLDSNIIFSALIKDSSTRKIIIDSKEKFLFPEFIFQEAEKHMNILIKKSGMEIKHYTQLLQLILRRVEFVPNSKLLKHKEESLRLTKNIDINDALFVACALAYPGSAIWSDDKKLKKIKRMKVLNTKEIFQLYL